MSASGDTVQITVPAEIHARIQECIAARDEGMRLAQEADRSGWNSRLIDQAIDVLAATGEPFSANDLRVLLPIDIPGGLFGNRFTHAYKNRGVIRWVGTEESNKKNTHLKPIGRWIGVPT